MERLTNRQNRQTKRQTDKKTIRKTDRQTYGCKDKQADIQTKRYTDIQMD
jgi:hypothetical protein